MKDLFTYEAKGGWNLQYLVSGIYYRNRFHVMNQFA